MAGKNLLLPGEDPAEYASRLDGIFTAMAPRDDAEAEIVALVADDLWKLGRLARIEKGVTLGRIEELLAQTGTGEKASITGNAITTLGTALVTWSKQPIPIGRDDELARRVREMSSAVGFVEATVPGVPADRIGRCDDLPSDLHGKPDGAPVAAEVYGALFDAAREVMTVLLDRGHAEEAAQEELRASISGIALPNKEELAKLAKYRTMLELSLQRRLAALDQIRKLAAGSAINGGDVGKAKEFRVKLRVVA